MIGDLIEKILYRDMREFLPHFKFIEHSSLLLKKAWLVSKIAAETKTKVDSDLREASFESVTKKTGHVR